MYLIYMYKPDLALNNLQWLIWQKTKPNQLTIPLQITFLILILSCESMCDTLSPSATDRR